MALGNLTVRLGLDAADYISGLTKAEAEASKFAKQQERTSLAIDKQVKALQDQSAALGFSERQIKIAQLTLKGATDAQLKSADAALKQKEAFQAAEKAISNAAAKAKATADATAAIDKQVKALHDQVAVQGKSEKQAKLYALEQAGATKAQLASADAALRQAAAHEVGIKIYKAARVAVIALGAAVTAASALFVKIVGDIDDLDEAAQALGTSAVALSEYRRAASESGVAAEKFDTALTKLSVRLADAAGGGKDSQEAFKALGIEIRNSSGQLKTTDELLGNVADRFSTYRDGAEKTALAVELFGRAGARMIPFLNQGSEGLRKLTGVTEEGVKAARELQAQFDALKGGLQDIGTGIAISVMPFLTKMIQEFNAARDAAGGLLGALGLLAKQSAETLADPGAKIEDLRKKLEDLRSTKPIDLGDLIKFGSTEGRDKFNAGAIEGIEKELKFLKELQRNRALVNFRADYSNEGRGAMGTAPVIRRSTGGGGSKTDEAAKLAKKQLDEQISQLENFIKREDRLLEERNHTLDRLYDQDRISSEDYFSGRIKALDKQVFEKADIYREEIDNLKRFVSETKDQTLKLAALKEIGTKTEQQADFLSDSSRKATKLRDDAEKALAAYGTRVEEVRLKVLELSKAEGSAGEVAARRFDASNADLLSKANLKGDEETKRNLALLRQREVSQADINQLLQDAQLIEERLGTTEGRLNLERNLGLRGELASLGELGKARAASLPDLQRIADRYREIAAVSGDERLIAAADRFNLKIQELAATTDVLADKFRNVFQDSFADAFANFIDGTTSAKDAFKAFADDVVRQINRMAAQEIASSLFGKGSGGSDSGILGGIIEAIVGAMAAGEKGGPVSGSTPYIVGERGPEIFVPRTVAAAATKQIDSLIAQKGKPAEYTDRVKAATVATNIPHLIGAKGPEIFVPKVDGIVIPNDKVNKLSRVLQGRANGGPVVSATPYIVGERGPEIFTPRNAATVGQSEKVVTRLVSSVQPKASQVAANLPRVVGARGPELFVPKAAGIIIPNDKVAKLARSFGNDRPNVPSYSPPGGTPRLAGQMLAVGRSSQPTDFDLSSERSSLVAAVARRREISAPLARTILRDEKIITRYANAPYSRRASGGPVAAHVPYIVGERGSEIFIPKSASATAQRDEAISKLSKSFQKQGHSASVATAQATRIINEELVANAPRQRRADGGPVAASTPYVVGELGPELFMPKAAERIIKHEKAVDDLVSNKIQHRASSPVAANVSIEREIFISKLASTNIKNEKFITDLVSKTIQHRASVKNERVQNDLVSNTRNEKIINLVSNIQRGPFAAHQTYLINEREIPSAKVIADDKAASVRLRNVRGSHYGFLPALELGLTSAHTPLRSLNFTPRVAQQRSPVLERRQHQLAAAVSSVQRRAIGGPGAAHQNFVSKLRPELYVPQGGPTLSTDVDAVRSGAESRNSNWVKNEKVIYDLITNTIQHRAQSGPVQARQTYVVGERGPELLATKSAEKIIKNESRVSELVTNNARRNEKVINDLVSKTVHHRQNAVAAPDVAAKIIKNESRISELVSNDVQRNEEIINRLVTNTRREGGRSNQLLIVGANGPELFIPKAAGSIVKNERRINELVSNIEHHNIDRRNEKTIDEIISDTVQRRARGGPVGANQPYIVGERGPEWFVPKTSGTIISNGKAGGMTVQNTFVLPPGPVTRDTQIQIAASVSRSVGLANRRLN